MSAIVVDGYLVHYEASGRGRPIVFLHGWLGSWRYWMPTMEELASQYRSYAFDLWGFGDTDRVRERHHVDAFVKLLEAFLETLGIWRVSLVGHALGAVVAVKFASLFPQRVERVMAVSLPMSKNMINQKALLGGGIFGTFGYRWQHYEEVAGEAHKTDAHVIPASIQSLATCDICQALSMLDMPTLLVHGAKDPIVKPFPEKALNSRRPNTRLIAFEESKHFPMFEERSKFNRLIKDFLAAGDDLHSLELKVEWRRRTR